MNYYSGRHSPPGNQPRTFGPRVLLGAALLLLAAGCSRGGSYDEPLRSNTVAPSPPKTRSAAPAITAIAPQLGSAGTEFSIHGEHFSEVTRISIGTAQVLAFRVENEKLIRAWLPKKAATGLVSLDSVAGFAVSPSPLRVVPATARPSRQAMLDQPFVEVPGSRDQHSRKLDFPELRRTAQYEVLSLPKAPVFHPYHPSGSEDGSLQPGHDLIQFSLNLKLPAVFQEVLPPAIQARLLERGLGPDQVDMFCVSQNLPGTAALLFRPHYWTDPEAPAHGSYQSAHQVQVGIFEAAPAVHFLGHQPGTILQANISVHPGEHSIIVSSPDNLAVAGLTPLHSQSFWTLTQVHGRAAATLHLLLSQAEQPVWEAILLRAGTFRELLGELKASPLAGSAIATNLERLARPRVESSLTLANTGILRLLFKGSGFTGASALTIDGRPKLFLDVISDNALSICVPELSQGRHQVIVQTPLGACDPVDFEYSEGMSGPESPFPGR